MDGNLSLILAFLVSISVVLALVIKFKLHPFLSLFIGCLLMGVCSGLDPMAIIKTSCKGFGDTMGDIGIIILLGVAMGQILHESGCTREIANTMLRLCGREKSALALNLTGYIISIPVFFDAAFVILIGLGSITVSIVTASAVLAPVASQLGASPVLVGLAICCGGIGLGLPNDSGFWTICKMSGLSTKQAFLVYPIPTLISGLVGLAVLLILNMFASSLPGLM